MYFGLWKMTQSRWILKKVNAQKKRSVVRLSSFQGFNLRPQSALFRFIKTLLPGPESYSFDVITDFLEKSQKNNNISNEARGQPRILSVNKLCQNLQQASVTCKCGPDYKQPVCSERSERGASCRGGKRTVLTQPKCSSHLKTNQYTSQESIKISATYF